MNEKNYNVVEGFNIIAPAYDFANDAMTMGLHRRWRRKMCQLAAGLAPKSARILDVATGTGDVAFEICELRHDVQVIGADPSSGMLDQARKKHLEKNSNSLKNIEFVNADGRSLPFADNSFDLVTVSWGIRNIKPYEEGLREIMRVLKPGSSVLILESGKPEFKAVKLFYQYYSKLLPLIGERISHFKPAYQYYTKSVEEFPSGSEFVARLFELGFQKPNAVALSAGIVYIYSASKPLSLGAG